MYSIFNIFKLGYIPFGKSKSESSEIIYSEEHNTSATKNPPKAPKKKPKTKTPRGY